MLESAPTAAPCTLPRMAPRQARPARLEPLHTCIERGGVELVESIADEWRELCERSAYNEPFYRPEWIAAAVRSFYPRADVLVLTAREGSRLCGVLPLVQVRRGFLGLASWVELRSATDPRYSCRFDMVCAPGREAEIAAAFWFLLAKLPEWHCLTLTNVPEGASIESLVRNAQAGGEFAATRRELERSPYLLLNRLREGASGGDLAQFAESAKLRSNLRRYWRRMQSEGEIKLRVSRSADAFKEFCALEELGWKGRRGTAIASSPETREFYRRIARAAERHSYLCCYFMECGGKLIAARLGLLLAGCYFPLKIAYDEARGQLSPGHVIVGLSLTDAVQRGAKKCDWLGRQSEWKSQWTSAARLHSNIFIFRRGILGGALSTGEQLRFKCTESMKRARRCAKPLVQKVRGRWKSFVAAMAARPPIRP